MLSLCEEWIGVSQYDLTFVLNPAHPSVTWLRCVHQFVRSQNEFDSSNSCGHDPQQYIFLVKMVLIIKTNAPFL